MDGMWGWEKEKNGMGIFLLDLIGNGKRWLEEKKVINILPLSLAFYDPPKCME